MGKLASLDVVTPLTTLKALVSNHFAVVALTNTLLTGYVAGE